MLRYNIGCWLRKIWGKMILKGPKLNSSMCMVLPPGVGVKGKDFFRFKGRIRSLENVSTVFISASLCTIWKQSWCHSLFLEIPQTEGNIHNYHLPIDDWYEFYQCKTLETELCGFLVNLMKVCCQKSSIQTKLPGLSIWHHGEEFQLMLFTPDSSFWITVSPETQHVMAQILGSCPLKRDQEWAACLWDWLEPALGIWRLLWHLKNDSANGRSLFVYLNLFAFQISKLKNLYRA